MPLNSLTIIDGFDISQATVDSGGTLFLEGGATASGTMVNSGGDLYAAQALVVANTIVNSGGREDLAGGSFADGTVVLDGGLENIYDSAFDEAGVIYGNMYVYDSGTALGDVVNAGGAQYVEDYAVAEDTVVNSGGVQYVEDRASVLDTVLNGGALRVAYAGSSLLTTISSGGTEIVSAGGNAIATTVSSGGQLDVLTGGIATDFDLFSGSTISKAGTLLANDGTSVIAGAVAGAGTILIGNGVLDIQRAAFLNLTFQPGGTGGLQLDVASAYTGKVTGFGDNSSQFIDFTHIDQAGAILFYTPNSSNSGVLVVKSGGSTLASINMVGQYTAADFTPGNDGSGQLEITDPPVAEQKAGNAPATIASGTVLEVKVADSGEVTFAAPTGTLWLDHPGTFTGKVADFGAQDGIDLPSIPFGVHTTLGYSENSSDTGGTLSVKNGTHIAKVALLGNYMAASFVAAADGHGGTLITEASQTANQQPLLSLPHK